MILSTGVSAGTKLCATRASHCTRLSASQRALASSSSPLVCADDGTAHNLARGASSAEFVIANISRGHAADHERPDRRVDHNRRPCDVGDGVVASDRDALTRDRMHHSVRELEHRKGRVGRRRSRLIGQGDGDVEIAVRGGDVAGQGIEIEHVGGRAHAEKDRAPVPPEIVFPDGALQDRHHSGNAGAAGNAEEMLGFLRPEHGATERTEYAHLRIGLRGAEQPVAEGAAGLALDDQSETLDVGREVDHGIGAPSFQVRRVQHDELPGLERDRRGQVNVEVRHVRGEPADIADHAAPRSRGGCVHDDDLGRHPQHAVRCRTGLAHQDVALVGLEPRGTGRILPGDLDDAAHDSRATSPARSSRALIRKRETLPQTGTQDRLSTFAIEGHRRALALDRDLHRRGTRHYLKKSSSMSSSVSNS